MATVFLRFWAECNDFLPPRRRHEVFSYTVADRQSIKDVVEAVGVPHPEIALILVGGKPVDFGYLVQDGDCVDVYPAYSSFEVPGYGVVGPSPEPRFLLDVHLGRLAEYLRLLGFDTLYRNDYDDPELAAIAGAEERILLTRDIGLLKRRNVVYGAYVRATNPQQQIVEIVRRFSLWDALQPFQRCSRCNGRLFPVAKDDIEDQLLPQTKQEHDDYRQCETCGQIYWEGSHLVRLREFIAELCAQRG